MKNLLMKITIFVIWLLIVFLLGMMFSCKKETYVKQPEVKISNYAFIVKSEASYSLRYTTDLVNFKDTNVTGNFIYKFTGLQKKFPDHKYQIGFSKFTIAPIELKITMDSVTVHSYFTNFYQYTISY